MTAPPALDNRRRAQLELDAMKEHHGQDGASSGRLRAAVFGINDGLVSNASLVIGVAAANSPNNIVLLAGIAGLVAGAFSMAAGEYLSMKVQRELFESLIASEKQEIVDDPEHERHEVSVIFQAKGVPQADAESIADHIMADPEVALDLMVREELGLNPNELGSPWGAAISSFLAFAGGAILPVLPYVFAGGGLAFSIALVLSGVALFGAGGLSARLTNRPVLFGASRMLLIGGLAAGVTYLVGRVFGATVT